MKKIKYILPAVVALMISVSCEDDAKKPFDKFQRGAIPLFAQGDGDSGFIDLYDFNSSKMAFEVNTEGETDVASLDIVITYNNAETGESNDATYTTLTTLPSDVLIGFDQLGSAFPKEVLTADSLGLGDSFTINGYVTTGDGRYLNGGYSPSVIANKPVSLNYNVACASDLGGTYDYSTTVLTLGDGGDADACSGVNTGEGELEDLGGGVYAISDVTFGVFACAYGDDPATGATLEDVCGGISFGGSDQYGDTYTMTFVCVDAQNLVFEWSNTYGDIARTTLTRNDGKTWPLDLH